MTQRGDLDSCHREKRLKGSRERNLREIRLRGMRSSQKAKSRTQTRGMKLIQRGQIHPKWIQS